jgi:hypothetical protein
MKIILSIGILFLAFANIFAEKTITCKLVEEIYQQNCHFSRITIRPNEAVSVKIDPLYANNITIETDHRLLNSFSPCFFTKFPNLRKILASGQNIQEIKPDTFVK